VRAVNRRLVAVGIVIAAAVVVAPWSQPRSTTGGTYRVGVQAEAFSSKLPWSDGLDPTGEYRREALAIYSNLLLRTLVGYDHVAGVAGYRLVPDLAESVPTPTGGGRTYTFTLKRGVRFAPPVGRAITSGDVRYAIERLARPANGSLAARTFGVLAGFDAYRAGKTKAIAGIATPDARTISFTLTRPAADFPHRLTLAATAPIPPEVGRCFEGKPGAYGADVVASGPYMVEGSEAVRIGSCSAIAPTAGLTSTQLTLVRNPSYDRRTDSAAARESNPDRFVFVTGSSVVEILNKLDAGELDDAFLTAGPKVLGRYAARAERRGLLRVDSADWVFWISMNLTRPPFDDVHVRRAMNWVVDRAALREAWGGSQAGAIADHVLPDLLLGNALKGYAPFRTAGDRGDLARARAELAKSRYANKGGVCTASACKGVRVAHAGSYPGLATAPEDYATLTYGITYAASQRMNAIVDADAAKIGITLRRGAAGDSALRTDVPANNWALTYPANWYAVFGDPASVLEPLFASADIVPTDNVNYALAGITPAQAARLGVEGKLKGVPSVDADLARCGALAGLRRVACYAALDRKLTTQIVPGIPFLSRSQITILGPQVAKWQFDQAAGLTALAHVAVKR
jgi:peptide/nickel transport system substrate-binding protein